MGADPDVQPLGDGELLFRRVPARPEFYDAATGGVREAAFRPTTNDSDGLSLSRERVGPAGAAATGAIGRQFYVARFRAADLMAAGLTIIPDRDDHAVIVDLTHAKRQSKDAVIRDRLAEVYALLMRHVLDVSGPFPGRTPPPPTSPPSPA